MKKRNNGFMLLTVMLLLLPACTTTYPRRDPVGQAFPAVYGTTVGGRVVALPADLAGRPAVLLVLYQSAAQDELNYWAAVATANMPDATILEVAVFTKLEHRLFRRRLEARALEHIPPSLHDQLVSVFDPQDAERITRFTGNPRDGHPRVLLLDERGRVVHFTDAPFTGGSMRPFLDAYRARWGWDRGEGDAEGEAE